MTFPSLADMLITDETSSAAEEILPLLHGIAKAVYQRDKRLLDADADMNIGNVVQLDNPAAAGQSTTKTIFEARARNEKSPELYTIYISPADVTLGNQNADGTIVQPDFTVTTLIEWGAGGAKHTVQLDCLKGGVITLSGTFVRVSAVLLVIASGSFPLQGAVSVSASASYGTRGPGAVRGNVFSVAARTAQPGHGPTITAGFDSVEVPVPAFAEKVTVFIANVTAAPPVASICELDFVLANGTDLLVQATSGQEIVLPGQAISVVARNNNAFDIQVTFVFQLSM